MELLSHIVLIVLPVFLVIGLGVGLRRTSLVGNDFLFALNRLVFYVALPALLFHKISSAEFSASFNVMLLAGLLAALLLTAVFSYLFGRLRGYQDTKIGAFSQGAFRSNVAYIGIAISYNAYGDEGLAIASLLTGFVVPVLNCLSVIVLLLPHRNGADGSRRGPWLQQLGLNPLIIASLAGVAWSLAGVPKPAVLDRTLEIVTGMALPLALLSIGASFSLNRLRGDLRTVAAATLFKVFFMPLLAVIVLLLLGVHGRELGIGFVLAGAPTAAAAFVMAQQLRSDAELSASIIMVSTLCSLFTYSVGFYLLLRLQL